jgi:hypothetical protein
MSGIITDLKENTLPNNGAATDVDFVEIPWPFIISSYQLLSLHLSRMHAFEYEYPA